MGVDESVLDDFIKNVSVQSKHPITGHPTLCIAGRAYFPTLHLPLFWGVDFHLLQPLIWRVWGWYFFLPKAYYDGLVHGFIVSVGMAPETEGRLRGRRLFNVREILLSNFGMSCWLLLIELHF